MISTSSDLWELDAYFRDFLAIGYSDCGGGGLGRVSKGFVDVLDARSTWIALTTSFPRCVEWEYFTIKNRGAGTVTLEDLTIDVIEDTCDDTLRDFAFVDGTSRPACGCPGAPIAVTEIYEFPGTYAVDQDIPPTFEAPPASGAWLSEWVFATPGGDPRPLGGVRWSTGGPGLAAGDEYGFGYAMLGGADSHYEVHTFDALSGDFASHTRDVRPRIAGWTLRPQLACVNPAFCALQANPVARGDHAPGADPSESVLPAVEPRIGGVQFVEVSFNRPVALADPAAAFAFDKDGHLVPTESITLSTSSSRAPIRATPIPTATPRPMARTTVRSSTTPIKPTATATESATRAIRRRCRRARPTLTAT